MLVKSKNDEGAALAMVLIFIAFLGLWMASLAVLIQTGSATLSKNADENARRANLVNSVIPRVMNELNNPCRIGLDQDSTICDSTGDSIPARCNEYPFRPGLKPGILTYSVLNNVKGKTINDLVEVQCTQATKSGLNQPIASFFLTGGIPPGGSGVIGVDGGLSIPNLSKPLVISGGIVNISGAWNGVDSTTFQLQKICSDANADPNTCQDPSPKVIQPSGSDCPAKYYGVSCDCPTWSSSNPIIPSSNCPIGADGSTFASLDPTSEQSELRSYIDSILAPLEDVYQLAQIPNDCTSPNTTSFNGTPFYFVRVTPGVIDVEGLKKLNSLMSSSKCGGGSTSGAPAIVFTEGIYRLDFGLAGVAPDTRSGGNVLQLDGPNYPLVILGVPKKGASGFECDTSKKGAQFQFADASYLYLGAAIFSACPLNSQAPVLVAPWSLGNIAPFSWLGDGKSPIIKMTKCGSANPEAFFVMGQIFVPSASVDLCMNNSVQVIMEKGLVAKALKFSGTGSAKSAGSVAPPSPYNGDRIIQLRIKTSNLDLGMIQVVIRDYYGRRQGAGYKIISWRTIW